MTGAQVVLSVRGAGGGTAPGDHVPEDWIASVTTQAGEVGLSTASGTLAVTAGTTALIPRAAGRPPTPGGMP